MANAKAIHVAAEVCTDLRAAFPEPGFVSTDESDLVGYSRSLNPQFPGSPHSVVVHVFSTEDVVKVIEISRNHNVPLVVYSGGTGLEASQTAAADDRGSICVEMSGMNKIIQINESDGDVVVQAGVVWNILNDTLKQKGIPLFFPLDPGLGATIGGIIAMGCSGTNAVRYGTARGEWILNLTVVLPSGKVIKTRRRSRKSSVGFDMTKSFIGSEGTLGIVTEAVLRLAPLLPTSVGVVSFPNVHKASMAVGDILNRGGMIQCAELIDSIGVESINVMANKDWPLTDTVLFKYQGSKAVTDDTAHLVEEISSKYDGTNFHYFEGEESEEIWNVRKMFLFFAIRHSGYRGALISDVCVPVSCLPDLILSVKKEAAEKNILAPMGGHIGDGNFHAYFLYKDEEELKLVNEILEHMIGKALELDGTCTGEHGVGLSKKKYLVQELGVGTVELMCAMKRMFDPENLFNPGKLYPEESLAMT